uniref:Guanylate kinase-like domain-containing protein n=1 Tax=Schistocephalus solidus TaxID=70667 RepID=A0A0V0JAF1_SCHSO
MLLFSLFFWFLASMISPALMACLISSLILSAADPVWSPHGYGPKQIRRFERSRKLKMAKLKGLLSSKSRKTGAKNRREYFPSMSLAQIGQSDEDQLHWLEQEAIKSSVRRPSLLTYEPVELYYPQPQRRRPLIFVGPAHAGRQRLVEGLVDSDSKRFALPMIHTTNPEAKSTNHQVYECVTKEAFQQMQREHKLIEWGVFNQHYYGTTQASLEKLIRAGKTGVLSLRPDSIRAIRRTPFLPCVVFISPPERLESLRQLTATIFSPTMCSDDELAACIEQSKKIEMHYGHFFDFVLVPQDFQSGLQELRSIALNLDRKPQWVPAHWIPLAIEVAARAAEEAKRSSANSGP